MLNYPTLTLLFTTALTAHRVILLNEETLILVCFVTFIWLSLKSFSSGVQQNLTAKVSGIKNNLEKSLQGSALNLQHLLNARKKFWCLLQDFKNLGQSCLKFTNLTTDLLVINSAQSTSELLLLKLQFTKRVESQTARLLSKLVILKLKKAVELKNFYSLSMRNPHFICFNKIVTRECIQKINPSN